MEMEILERINNKFFWLKCNENLNAILFTRKLPLSHFYFCYLELFAHLVLDWDSFVCSKSLLRTTASFSVYYCQPWWNQTEELPQKSTGVPEMQYKGLVLGPFPQTGALPVTLIAHGRSPKNTCDLCCSSARSSRLHLTTNWARRENTANTCNSTSLESYSPILMTTQAWSEGMLVFGSCHVLQDTPCSEDVFTETICMQDVGHWTSF